MNFEIKENILHYYTDLLREKSHDEIGKSLHNVIRTMRLSRHDKVCGENFSRLDFGNIPLNGIHFSMNGNYPCDFSNSKLDELCFLSSHTAEVTAISSMFDEKQLITGGKDRRTIIWDIESGLVLHTNRHPGIIKQISTVCDSDGEYLLVFSRNIHRRYYALEEFNRSTDDYDVIEDSDLWLRMVCFSSDGKYAFMWTTFTSRIWNNETGENILLEENVGNISVSAFSTKNRYLLCGYTNSYIKIWETSSGRLINTILTQSGSINTITTFNDEGLCLVGSETGRIAIYDILSGNLYWENDEHSNEIVTVAISADYKNFLSASKDATVRIWDITSKQCVHILKCHSDEITCAAFSTTGQLCFTGSKGGTIKMWDVKTGVLVNTIDGSSNFRSNVAFTSDEKKCISCLDCKIARIWNIENRMCIKTLHAENKDIRRVFTIHNNMYYITGSNNEAIRIWNAITEECICTIDECYQEDLFIRISPDMNYCAISTIRGIIKLLKINCNGRDLTIPAHNSQISAMEFSPDSKFLITGSYDTNVKIWNLSTGDCYHTFVGHKNPITSVALSSDGRFCIAGSLDGTSIIWDCKAESLLYALQGHNKRVSSVSFISNDLCITGSSDCIAKIWGITTGKCLHTYNIQSGDYDFIQWEFPYCIFSGVGIQTIFRLNYNIESDTEYEKIGSFYNIEHLHISNCRFHSIQFDSISSAAEQDGVLNYDIGDIIKQYGGDLL